jgi:hypothetical protein
MEVEQGPKPVAESEPLWRYVRLSTLFLYLSGKAYIPSIKALQQCDPTEGLENTEWDPTDKTSGFTEAEEEELRRWVYEWRSPAGKDTWKINLAYADPRSWVGTNWWVTLQRYWDVLNQSRYAWCWFNSKYESAAMWQFYGQGGVAIKTSVGRLSKALAGTGKPWLVSGLKYLDRNQDTPPAVGSRQENMGDYERRPFLVKRIEYQHECEVRLVTVDPSGRPGILLDGLGPGEWIEQIVFWPGFPESETEVLVAAVSKLAPGLPEKPERSRLFERNPRTVLPSEWKQDLEDTVRGSGCREAAEKWPPFMQKP